MTAVDTNILLYAHFRGFPLHERARAWLRILAEGPRPWALPVFCVGEFLRVATHPRVMSRPSTMAVAWKAIAGLLESPTLRILTPGPRFLPILSEILDEGGVTGNLVFDAQIAALCVDQGVARLLTADADFRRFRQLQIVDLSDPPA